MQHTHRHGAYARLHGHETPRPASEWRVYRPLFFAGGWALVFGGIVAWIMLGPPLGEPLLAFLLVVCALIVL